MGLEQVTVAAEDTFSNNAEIDSWHNLAMHGLTNGLGAVSKKPGPTDLSELNFYTGAVGVLNKIKKSMYAHILGRDNPKLTPLNKIIEGSLEHRFTTQQEIDGWYERVLDGLSRGVASVVRKGGLRAFNEAEKGKHIYKQTLDVLNNVRRSMYVAVLEQEPAAPVAYHEMVMRYVKTSY